MATQKLIDIQHVFDMAACYDKIFINAYLKLKSKAKGQKSARNNLPKIIEGEIIHPND